MRVALNLEQCFQRPPGGIGRYAVELARVLPDAGAPGEVVVVPFVARHSAREIATVAERRPGLSRSRRSAVPPAAALRAVEPLGSRRPAGRSHSDAQGVDVVHAPSVAVPPRGRVPLVVTVHDARRMLFPDTYPRRGRRFHELGLRRRGRTRPTQSSRRRPRRPTRWPSTPRSRATASGRSTTASTTTSRATTGRGRVRRCSASTTIRT